MMVENPVYHFRALGITTRLEGQDQVKALYVQWASTGECVFHAENRDWRHHDLLDRHRLSTEAGGGIARHRVRRRRPRSCWGTNLYGNDR